MQITRKKYNSFENDNPQKKCEMKIKQKQFMM